MLYTSLFLPRSHLTQWGHPAHWCILTLAQGLLVRTSHALSIGLPPFTGRGIYSHITKMPGSRPAAPPWNTISLPGLPLSWNWSSRILVSIHPFIHSLNINCMWDAIRCRETNYVCARAVSTDWLKHTYEFIWWIVSQRQINITGFWKQGPSHK